jgi:hypothetical protein
MAPAWVWDPKREGGGFLGREWLGMGQKMDRGGISGVMKSFEWNSMYMAGGHARANGWVPGGWGRRCPVSDTATPSQALDFIGF